MANNNNNKATSANNLLNKLIPVDLGKFQDAANNTYNKAKEEFHKLDPKVQNTIRNIPGYYNTKAIMNGTMATLNKDDTQKGKDAKFNAQVALMNQINPVYKNIPSNVKTMTTAMVAPNNTTIDGNLMHSPSEINAMRDLVDKSEFRQNNMQSYYGNKYLQGDDPQGIIGEGEGGVIPQYQRPGVQFLDYELAPGKHALFDGRPSSMVMNSFIDPFYSIRTTEGRFNYNKDPSGNVVVTDDYNFIPNKAGNDLYDNIREQAFLNVNDRNIKTRTNLGMW